MGLKILHNHAFHFYLHAEYFIMGDPTDVETY